jgi:hypothetical protein
MFLCVPKYLLNPIVKRIFLKIFFRPNLYTLYPNALAGLGSIDDDLICLTPDCPTAC